MSALKVTPPKKSEINNASLSQTGTFYGWWIVLAGTTILFVSSGIGFYGHGVILDPLRTAHGWSKATISSAITLYFLTAGIMGILIGRQVDKYGPKWVLIFGFLTRHLNYGKQGFRLPYVSWNILEFMGW